MAKATVCSKVVYLFFIVATIVCVGVVVYCHCFVMQLFLSFLVFVIIHLERAGMLPFVCGLLKVIFSVVVYCLFFLMMWVCLLFMTIACPGHNYLLFGYIHIIIIVT